MKKALALALALVMIFSLAACGSNSAASETKAEPAAPAASDDGAVKTFENLSFTWYKNYDWYSAENWGESNEVEQMLINDYHVNIEFQDAGGAAAQKLATMFLDDEYPDVISVDRDQTLDKLISSGVAVPLDDYLDKYPNLKNGIGEATLNMLRAEDGKLYSFPNWAAPIGQLSGNSGWMIQEKYYKELGEPKLETYEDLYEYLKLVKETYPNVTPLELGPRFFSSAMRALYGGFGENLNPGYAIQNVYDNGNGTLQCVLDDPYYVQALLFVNKLYNEGLISKDIFTMTDDNLKEHVRNGTFAVACLADIFDTDSVYAPSAELNEEDPSFNLRYVEPLAAEGVNVANVKTNFTDCLGWNVSVITKSAEDPEKIFAFLDWWFGPEGQLMAYLGLPGLYYDADTEKTAEGYPVKMREEFFAATSSEIDSKWMNSNWVGNTAYIDNLARYVYDETGYAQQLKKDQFNYTWNHSIDSTALANITPALDTDIGIIYQNIDNIYAEALPTIATAGTEAEALALIEKYKGELEGAGLAELLKYQNEVYSANLSRLGK